MKEFPYHKVLIVGCGGAGKSTLAVEMGKLFHLPIIHLDKLWWLPNWQSRTKEEFDEMLIAELMKSDWIMEGNFSRTFETRLKYADLCIFLDYDTEVCVDGVYKRIQKYNGVSRPDMADGCVEHFNEEFINWIKAFNQNTRPMMLTQLKNAFTPYVIFKSREDAASWLDEFTKQ